MASLIKFSLNYTIILISIIPLVNTVCISIITPNKLLSFLFLSLFLIESKFLEERNAIFVFDYATVCLGMENNCFLGPHQTENTLPVWYACISSGPPAKPKYMRAHNKCVLCLTWDHFCMFPCYSLLPTMTSVL